MSIPKLRRRIAVEAARLMYERLESEYFTAKRKAAARFGVNPRHQPQDLPSNREIRDEIQTFARIHEGERRFENLGEMRKAALGMMRLLARFEPRLIGSVRTGHVRAGSDIDLHVFSLNASGIGDVLDRNGYQYDIEHKRVIKHNEARVFTHIHVHDHFTFELTVYKPDQLSYVFKSSITGKAIERASIGELEELIAREHPDIDLDTDDDEPESDLDPCLIWSLLLPPLANVRQDPAWHPEGDALYHSLQAFEIARDEHPHDIELITAALLHDVGKAIDAHDHVAAGLEALEGTLSTREHFLIAHHMDAQACRDRTLGAKQHRRLRQSEWFDDLMLLRDIDDRARTPGVDVCSAEEAIEHLRAMSDELDE
jgi:hypothetical protein